MGRGSKVSELRREAWGGSRSLSLPSAAEQEKVRSRRYVGDEKWRIAMVESDSLLTGLDLAHVSIVVVGGGGGAGTAARRITTTTATDMVASTNFKDIIDRKCGGGTLKVLPFDKNTTCINNKRQWPQQQQQQQRRSNNNNNKNVLLRPSRLSLPTPSPLIGATIQTDRRQRHSISGLRPHHAYLHKPSASSATSSVFSTAVISGAASAPNLTDIISNTASVSEGCGGVPPIRPLETLHNALSLKQLDTFLERVSHNIKTPASSPPKVPSSPRPTSPSGTGWSDPPSFVSSSGASSPTPLPEFFLAQRLASSTNSNYYSHRDSIEVAEFYSRSVDNTHFSPIVDGESGEVTPVSAGSDEDMCSETLLHEADTTVIPTDTPRLRLADICWDKPQEENTAEGDCEDSNVGTPTPTPSRFVCTSVNEPVQYEPALTLATSSAESTSVGFHVAPAGE